MEAFNLHALKSNPWKAVNHSESETPLSATIIPTEDGYTIWFHQILDILKNSD